MKERISGLKRKAKNIDNQSVLEIIYEEVKSLSGTYYKAIEGLDSKAATLFGSAVLIVGICAGLGPYVVDRIVQSHWVNFFILIFAGSIIFLVCSAVLSLLTYRVRGRALGPDLKFLDGLRKNRSKEKVLEKLVKKYRICIRYNRMVIRSKSKKIKLSLLTMSIGVSMILADVFISIVAMH